MYEVFQEWPNFIHLCSLNSSSTSSTSLPQWYYLRLDERFNIFLVSQINILLNFNNCGSFNIAMGRKDYSCDSWVPNSNEVLFQVIGASVYDVSTLPRWDQDPATIGFPLPPFPSSTPSPTHSTRHHRRHRYCRCCCCCRCCCYCFSSFYQSSPEFWICSRRPSSRRLSSSCSACWDK